jgi:hypothetical protein
MMDKTKTLWILCAVTFSYGICSSSISYRHMEQILKLALSLDTNFTDDGRLVSYGCIQVTL